MDCEAIRRGGSVRQRRSVQQCERQRVAVRTVVCAWQCAAVRFSVNGSASGRMPHKYCNLFFVRIMRGWLVSVPQCGSAAVCGSVRQCAAVCGSVRQWGSVRQCAAVCGSVRQCAAVCGSVRECAAVCASVRECAAMCGSVTAV
jgi:hypothetical protein